jgi:hypothetical protein
MRRLPTLLAPVLAVASFAVAGPIAPASAATSVDVIAQQLVFPPNRHAEKCKSHGAPIRLRGRYTFLAYVGKHGRGRTSHLRGPLKLQGGYYLRVCIEAHRRTYEIEATITNARTGGRAVVRQLLFGGAGSGDYDWGTELVHRR